MSYILNINHTDMSLEVVEFDDLEKAKKSAREECRWENTRHVTIQDESGTVLYSIK